MYKKKILSQKKEPLRSPKFKVGQVRSVEECEIANFLFLKGIEYIYEDDYPKEKIPAEWKSGYKPDFHLIKKDEKGNYIMMQEDVDRVQEFRKCIECYLCQNVCHVLRDHDKKDQFVGPRFMIRLASLEMHPLDTADRIPATKNNYGSGLCNITRCCTDVCPEHIQITDNAIIPIKERVVDRYYDPIIRLFKKLFSKNN